MKNRRENPTKEVLYLYKLYVVGDGTPVDFGVFPSPVRENGGWLDDEL